jgi:hypothetical protein
VRSRRAPTRSAPPLNCGVSRQPEVIVVGVRLGYFEDFKGDNTLLLDGDADGLGELARILGALAVGERHVVSVHSLPFVSAENQVELHAHRSPRDIGVSKTVDGFQWRRSPEGWAAVVEQILAVREQGRCHQYLDAPSDDVTVMVSSGEYPER